MHRGPGPGPQEEHTAAGWPPKQGGAPAPELSPTAHRRATAVPSLLTRAALQSLPFRSDCGRQDWVESSFLRTSSCAGGGSA